eukprot:3981175-Amphidinium_carterae.1
MTSEKLKLATSKGVEVHVFRVMPGMVWSVPPGHFLVLSSSGGETACALQQLSVSTAASSMQQPFLAFLGETLSPDSDEGKLRSQIAKRISCA